MSTSTLPDQARAIWQAGVAAVDPRRLVRDILAAPRGALRTALESAERILVVGAGKAGAAMALGVEEALPDRRDRIIGVVNIPEGSEQPTRAIRLHGARPAGSNHPTEAGVAGAEAMLQLLRDAGPNDLAFCLLSGGGSALLPAPVEGVSLADKQKITRLLHACGATIQEMNCVRKHLSRVKGGRLAEAFGGRALFSLILSDVVGDPLDVIASGPTAPDPSTYADALAVLDRYGLRAQTPHSILAYLEAGVSGDRPETLKALPDRIHNEVIGNNARALAAASRKAEELGWPVLNLGSYLEGETRPLAETMADLARSIGTDGLPCRPPVCVLSGGETTVTLSADAGQGGRNQEFTLAALLRLRRHGLGDVLVLSAGTDGEDGPTDAAGALGDGKTLARAEASGLSGIQHLARHDAYPFFEAGGGLLKTGLTGTNVMDLRILFISHVQR